ncbi:stage V sporulation protein AA [Coprococcus comes]|jgi:stage V sporulation protein AA|uniref:stage V sporulation protein AA n=1 Tax=Coprococcus comes TaxID=410072 RepID=UPI00189869CC|nr:stage V sporulation protein AA [Coprococcus comes]
MSSGNEILYIKGEKNTEVKEPNVTLGDILTMECSNSSILNRIKPLRILKIPKKEQHRYVVSVLKIIECIHREIPGLQIQNEGESDLIITYEGEKKRNAIWQGIKVVVVAGITFIGAAFSIMAFNNDVSVTKMFSRIYLLLTGEESNGFTLIELTYCIGLIVGILIFFNHLGRKKFTADPTPMEVEMRLYENDIQETLIEAYARKEKEVDVD